MGQAGDFNYEQLGSGYAMHRRADPRIAAVVYAALGSAQFIVNVGAGAGSYEPEDRRVVAVEPSATMRSQRPAHLACAIAGVAEALPFADQTFDAAMAMVTVHQWSNLALGLREMRRVTRGPIVVLTADPDALDQFWLADYVPERIAVESKRMPPIAAIAKHLGGDVTVQVVPIPIDCTDGFTDAFYARPEQFLNPEVRRNQSSWKFVDREVEARFVQALSSDLMSGEWDRRYGHWRRVAAFNGSLRLITAYPHIA